MTEIKTKVTKESVTKFLKSIEPEEKCKDGLLLLQIFEEVTGEKAKLWGTNIVGFGVYHYKSERSAQEGDWPLTAFAVRKQNLTLYIMPGFDKYNDLLKNLGKHKTSVACLYIKRLSEVDIKILKKIIKRSFVDMKKRKK